jgi:hypothetical protein
VGRASDYVTVHQVAAPSDPDIVLPGVPTKPAARKRNEHPGVPDQPKPRRTSAQVAADRDAAQKRGEARAALIAEKRRQLAELEAEEMLGDQLAESTFVRTIGDVPTRGADSEHMEIDEEEPAGEAIEIDMPEMRADATDADDASEPEPAAKPKKTSRAKKAKPPKVANLDTAKSAKGAQKSAAKKGKVSEHLSFSVDLF